MSKIGRNDPCWCGSGTKYKKCHLSSDEAESRKDRDLQKEAEAHHDPVAEKLAGEILEGTERWHTREDFERASEIFYGEDPLEVKPDTDREDAFLEWYMRDFRPASSGRTPIDEYLAESGERLIPREREMVEAWRDGKYGFFEVLHVDFGVSVLLKDFSDRVEYLVADPLMAKQVKEKDCLLSRLDYFEENWMLSGDTVTLPRVVVRQILKSLDGSQDLRALSYKMHRTVDELTADWAGDIEVADMADDLTGLIKAELVCSDKEACMAEFRRAQEIEELNENFIWRGNGTKLLGNMTFEGDRLELTCASPTRLEIFVELVQHLAGQYLTLPETVAEV